MKVQIIYLNPTDDIHSARDKLSWVKAPRVLVVWPDRGKVLSTQLDLVLLQRFSLQRQVEIGFLTFDHDIRARARELCIPVFDSMDELPEAHWHSSQEEETNCSETERFHRKALSDETDETISWSWLDGLSNRKKLLLAGVIPIVVLIFLLLLIPSAIIEISPARTSRIMDITIIPATKFYTEGGTPLLPIKTELNSVSGSLTEETSGVSPVPILSAGGTVIFTNLSSQQIDIPADTIVRTSAEGGVRFKTIRPAKLSKQIGTEVEVPVEALTPGQVGNVPINSIVYIEGALGLLLSVTNPKSFEGGSDEFRGMVTQDDLEKIEENLLEGLLDQAESALKARIPSDRILVDGSIEYGMSYDRDISHIEGDISDSVTMGLTLDVVASSLSKDDLEGPALEALGDKLPQGTKIVLDSMEITMAKISNPEGSGEQRIILTVELQTYRSFDAESIKGDIRGQRLSAAFNLLFERLDLAFTPKITINPDWFPFIPLFRERIEFRWAVE